MEKDELIVGAWTPPHNGWIRAYNGKEIYDKKFIQDFRTYERYKEYKDCGFDEMLFAGENAYLGEDFETSELKMMLDLCARCEIGAWVLDQRILDLTTKTNTSIIGEKFETETQLDEYVKECVKDYKDHPAFIGVSIIDEPFIAKKDIIHQIARSIKRVLPNAMVHTCFNPLFCVDGGPMQEVVLGSGKDGYEAFGFYIDAMSVPELGYYCYDDYPFKYWEGLPLENKFLTTMKFASLRVQKNGLPLHMGIQSYACNVVDRSGNPRKLDQADFNWQANVSMGFGVKKVYYYTYWRFQTRSALERSDIAIMDDDGTPILYDQAKSAISLMKRIFKYVYDLNYEKSQVLGSIEDCVALEEFVSEDLGIIKEYSVDTPVLVNRMANGNKNAYMFFNCQDPNIKKTNRVTIKLSVIKPEYELLIDGERTVISATDGVIDLVLEPGEAVWILNL